MNSYITVGGKMKQLVPPAPPMKNVKSIYCILQWPYTPLWAWMVVFSKSVVLSLTRKFLLRKFAGLLPAADHFNQIFDCCKGSGDMANLTFSALSWFPRNRSRIGRWRSEDREFKQSWIEVRKGIVIINCFKVPKLSHQNSQYFI